MPRHHVVPTSDRSTTGQTRTDGLRVRTLAAFQRTTAAATSTADGATSVTRPAEVVVAEVEAATAVEVRREEQEAEDEVDSRAIGVWMTWVAHRNTMAQTTRWLTEYVANNSQRLRFTVNRSTNKMELVLEYD